LAGGRIIFHQNHVSDYF
jgi:hypothetical protein